jgi:hypothetical protein
VSQNTAAGDDPAVVRAYALLGLCATQFSALEFHIQFLLSFLHMGRECAVETVVFTRRSTFSEKISLISELLRLRLHTQPALLRSGLSLTADLEKYRDKRNLFIHGYWLVNRPFIMQGFLRVSNTRWKYREKEITYTAMDSLDISVTELEGLPREISDLIERTHQLLRTLKGNQPK